MKTQLFIVSLLLVTALSTFSQTKSNKMNTIVLVHGAWVDASCWDKVVPALKAVGHEVLVVSLPGHGADNTPIGSISLQNYVDAVKRTIGKRTDVTLVGHSLAGITISEVAEQIPDQIRNLVYISAFLLRNGETVLQLGNSDKESLLPKYLRPDKKNGYASIAEEGIQEVFAADAPQAVVGKLIAHTRPDALAPFATPVNVSDANFGRIPITYIYDFNDKLVSYYLQQIMVQNNGTVKRLYGLPSSHTPFFSMPGVLADILIHESM
jgi:pimeloyl-ACP methyl ester carboxylesterase